MLISMTGYGRAENTIGENNVVIEIRTVNSRFLELVMRFPRGFESLEDQARTYLQKILSRGRVTVTMTLGNEAGPIEKPHLDEGLLLHYAEIAKHSAVLIGQDPDSIGVEELLKFPEVISQRAITADPEAFNTQAMQLVSEAADQMQAMRAREGQLMEQAITEQLNQVSQITARIQQADDGRLASMAETLRKKINDAGLEKEFKVDAGRIEQEIVIWSDKLDVAEELTRLQAHVQHFHELMALNGDAGKRLNFLLQEMNREANTIGSKANSTPIGHAVVELKNEIERIREQVQNIQ